MVRSSATLLLSAAMIISILYGCTTGKQGVNREAGDGSAAAGQNILRYAITSDVTNLDPAKVEDGATIDMLQSVFEGLVKWDEKNAIVPNFKAVIKNS